MKKVTKKAKDVFETPKVTLRSVEQLEDRVQASASNPWGSGSAPTSTLPSATSGQSTY